MPIINNNVQNVKFLRNQTPFSTRELARQALEDNKGQAADGTALLARYTVSGTVKTIVGFVYVTGSTHDITIFDTEGASGDVEKLRQEINAKLGSGVTSANTATEQLAALSGNDQSTSAETSVKGAKRYADELKNQMDYSGVTTGTGVYVTNVTQSDGIVSATTATLPTVTDAKVAKKVVVSVSEDKGQISIERGTISSTAETMVLADNTDGGVNFEVNIDNNTIIQDANTKKLKVADAALVQYEGDTKTIAISPVQNGVRTVSSIITLSSITPSSTTVKEEYALKNASGETIGSTIKIYKDSSIVEINYITDPADEHYQNLEYIYIDASGNTQTEHVDMSSLVLEAEFASGLTIENHVARGVVDTTSETFLTVGANGFKLSGVQDAINSAINALDVTGDTAVAGQYVAAIEQTDGVVAVKTRANVSEAVLTNYAKGSVATAVANTDTVNQAIGKLENQVDAAKAAATTVVAEGTDAGNNMSIAETAGADGHKIFTVNLSDVASAQGLADEIAARKAVDGQSGQTYAANTSANYISGATSLNDADVKLDAALKTADGRIDTVSSDVETIKNEYISGVSVNGNAVTLANKVAPISITAATSAATATSTEAIVVNTDNSGNITLGIANIDCGYYA